MNPQSACCQGQGLYLELRTTDNLKVGHIFGGIFGGI